MTAYISFPKGLFTEHVACFILDTIAHTVLKTSGGICNRGIHVTPIIENATQEAYVEYSWSDAFCNSNLNP